MNITSYYCLKVLGQWQIISLICIILQQHIKLITYDSKDFYIKIILFKINDDLSSTDI